MCRRNADTRTDSMKKAANLATRMENLLGDDDDIEDISVEGEWSGGSPDAN